MKQFNKLVRDNIPEIIEQNGEIPVVRILDENEYMQELNKKLKEEVVEYLEDNNVEELSDIYEVVLAILKAKNIKQEQFNSVLKSKREKRGSFDKKIFLEKTYKKGEKM